MIFFITSSCSKDESLRASNSAANDGAPIPNAYVGCIAMWLDTLNKMTFNIPYLSSQNSKGHLSSPYITFDIPGQSA